MVALEMSFLFFGHDFWKWLWAQTGDFSDDTSVVQD